MTLDQSVVEETKAKIERLIRQGENDEARKLLIFLRDQKVNPDDDIRQFQNLVGMPIDRQSKSENTNGEETRALRYVLLDRAISLSVAAFFFFATGSIILPLAYIAIDWIINYRHPLSVVRIALPAIGALVIYFLIALALVFAS